MNRLRVFFLLLIVSAFTITFCGCDEESADDGISFVVYGTIVDHSTGEPVRVAEVSLHTGTYPMPSGLGSSTPNGSIGSAVTGMDGQYEMHCIVTKNLMSQINNRYSLYIVTSGHSPYSEEVTMTVVEGMRVQQDAAI